MKNNPWGWPELRQDQIKTQIKNREREIKKLEKQKPEKSQQK